MNKDRILIIDGLNQIFRANVKWGGNKYENVIVYNFFRSIRSLFDTFRPDRSYFVVEGRADFRYKLFPQYKANRIVKTGGKEKKNEDFNIQRDKILNLIKFLPLTIVRAPNHEGDDAIYTLVNNLKDEDVTIISSDSDFIQLLQEFHAFDVKLYNPIKKLEVKASTNYSYLVWKSLNGDKTDNIPAIVKSEEAEKLASSPSLLKDFLQVEENRARFSLNRELISLRLVPHEELEIEQFHFNEEALKKTFHELDFQSMFKGDYWDKFVSTFSKGF